MSVAPLADVGADRVSGWREELTDVLGEGIGAVRVMLRQGLAIDLGRANSTAWAEILLDPAPGDGDWVTVDPEPPEPTEALAAVVGVGNTRARDLLTLLGRAYRWLRPGGRLLLLDYFTETRLSHGADGCLVRGQVLALAERAGFFPELDRPADLPWQPPSHGEGVAPEGRLLGFRRVGQNGRWRVTYQEPKRLGQVRALFQGVFGHEMSLDLWQWKYGCGRGQGALALRNDAPVGHYGVLTRPILYFGRPERAAQVADVMVESGDRGVLTRKGAFFLTAASMPEVCSGYGSKHLIGFGFPNGRHQRLAERLGLYAEVERITELEWKALRTPPAWRGTLDLADLPRERALGIVDRLWGAMAADLRGAIVGVRDGRWIQYRYLEHPVHAYRVLAIRKRWWQRPIGIAVLRLHEDRAELMDLVGPLAHLPVLVRAARQAAGRAGKDRLFCWITRGQAAHLDPVDAAAIDPDVCIPTSIHTAGPDPEEIRGRWWLMSGDTDFR